jgi:cyanophycinase-like exopeptidase
VLALHGGGEYVAGDEAAMDALLGAAVVAAGRARPRIVIVPTAVARHRPQLAVTHGQRAFEAAARRGGHGVDVSTALLLTRHEAEAAPASTLDRLSSAHLVHLPGGDPDLIPSVLRETPAWAAIREAVSAGACLAGASAGAMAMAARLWTAAGPMDGLGLLAGCAVLPHFSVDRLAAWRRTVGGDDTLRWIGIDEQTLAIGRPGSTWSVAGSGAVRVFAAAGDEAVAVAHAGEQIDLP